ncbi:MAG: HAD-IA family hydrolase [Myxococcota bacterium]
MNPPVRAVLFDLDGTLIDSIELIVASFRYTHRTHFGTDRPDEFWIRGIGRPLRDQLGDVAESREELQTLLDIYRTYNLEHHDRMARPYVGAVETVRRLAERGTPLALVTSKLRIGAERGLRLLGLEDEFPVRVCADDVTRGKPDPMPVHLALEQLRANPRETVFVGDSPHDMEAGRRAGVQTAAASWGPFEESVLREHAPTYWLAHIEEVLPLVTRSASR